VFGVSSADVSRIWRDHHDENYEEVFRESCGFDDFVLYPRVLVRNTIAKWLIGSANIIEAELWTFLRKQTQELDSPKIIFQTKPDDIWIMMFSDISNVATLNPRIIVPTGGSSPDVSILSIATFIKEQTYG
jgi:hypothetical protein